MKSNAYWDGYDAGREGYLYENPFCIETEEWLDYDEGYSEGSLMFLRETEAVF